MLNLVLAEETYVEDEICKRSDSSTEPNSDSFDQNKGPESNLEGLEDKKTIDGNDEVDPTDEKPSNGLDLQANCADEQSINGVVNEDSVNGRQTVEIKDQSVLHEHSTSESDSGSILPVLRSWLYEGSRYVQISERNPVDFTISDICNLLYLQITLTSFCPDQF
jgi:hypothetical protein